MQRSSTLVARLATLALVLAGCGSGSRLVEPADAPDDEPATANEPIERTDTASDAASDAALQAALDAMAAGDCDAAIAGFDAVLGAEGWNGDRSAVEAFRSECVDFQLIVADDDPASQFSRVVAFVRTYPSGNLAETARAMTAQLVGDHGAALLTTSSCDVLGGEYDLLDPVTTTDAGLTCAAAYADDGRDADAASAAFEVFLTASEVADIDRALPFVFADDATCDRLAGGDDFLDPVVWPDQQASLLQHCMDVATAAADLDTLAYLQARFLIELPGHAGTDEVAAALMENPAGCDLIDVLSPEVQPAAALHCAQVAEYVGDVDLAVARYEDFLDRYPNDPLATDATTGFARTLIAQARAGDTVEFAQPERTPGVGGSSAVVTFSNDTEYEQRLVFLGPEAVVIDVEASAISSTYTVPPVGCRDGVPTVTLELTPGTYEFMEADGVSAAEVGTWTLQGGSAYYWCSFYVSFYSG